MSSQSQGLIALDIDGTIAENQEPIPELTASALKKYHKLGWQLFLVTGRSFLFAEHALVHLDFPFSLAVQNGADILEYPSKKELYQSYISKSICDFIDPFYEGVQNHYVVYAGLKKGDFCYYNPKKFSSKMLSYLEKLKALSSGKWVEVDSNSEIQDKAPLIKCFGDYALLKEIATSLEGVSCSIIQDTIDTNAYILLITSIEANKGVALEHLKEVKQLGSPTIVGGNDRNDIPMLDRGDYRIVIEGAPEEVLQHADVVAHRPKLLGVVQELEKVIGEDGSSNLL